MNAEELKKMIEDKKIRYSHKSWTRGYMSRTCPQGVVESYRGRFGEGFVHYEPSWKSTTYHYVTYYITN